MGRTIKYKWYSFFALFVIYFISIHIYETAIYNLFAYMGFRNFPTVSKLFFISILFSFINLFIVLVRMNKFLYSIHCVILIFFSIPNFILYIYHDNSDIIIVISVALLHFLLFTLDKFKLPFDARIEVKGEKFIFYSFISLFLFFFVLTIRAFNPQVFFLEEIYSQRSAGKANLNLFTGYTVNLLGKIIIPLSVIIAIIYKKYKLLLFSIAALLYLFGVIALKSIFLSLFIILPFYFFKDSYKKIFVFNVFYFLFLLLSLALYNSQSIFFVDALVRRVFYTPAILNIQYINFFRPQPLYAFNPYNFDLPPSYIIGKYMYGSDLMNASNGFISDAYLQLGYLGVLLYTFFVAVLLVALSNFKLSSRFLGVFVLVIYTLIGAPFFTSLITHGIWFLLLLSFFEFNKKTQTHE